MPDQPPSDNVPNKYSWITVLSFLMAILLFALCAWYIFLKNPAEKKATPQPTITTTTSIKIDSIIKATGKKVVIDTTVMQKPVEVSQPDPEESMNKKLSTVFNYFLLLFGVFIILAILPRIKNFNFGKDGVTAEFYEVAKAINEAQSLAAQTPVVPQGGRTETEAAIKNFMEEKERLVESTGALDPQKGKWGGFTENNNRKITAAISRITGSEWAEIILRVESTDTRKHPLKGIVVFHLHPTFLNANPVIIVLNGIAELKIKAWGAFTVGAEADNGSTRLELDLKGYPGSYDPFNQR